MLSKSQSRRLRKAIVAGLMPGGGHLALGKPFRAAAIFASLFVLLGFASYALFEYYTASLPLLAYGLFKAGQLALAIGIPLWLLSIADAARLSLHTKESSPKRSRLLRWQEFKIALPDLSVAILFVLALLDYRSPLLFGIEFSPTYAYWGFFEILALPIAPTLVDIFLDQRRGPRAKAFAVALLLLGFGSFACAMNPLFGLNFVLFVLAKVVSFQLGRLGESDRLHVQRRAGMCVAALFVSGFCLVALKAWLSWTDLPLDSPTGELEMLVMGCIYFVCLATMNVWWLRGRMRAAGPTR